MPRTQATPLNILVWNGSERLSGYTTGVGKHVIHMVAGLAATRGVALEFVVPRDSWARDRNLGSDALLAKVPVRKHALTRRMAELAWLACSAPSLDDAATDWVYAPRERFASARKAKSIVTVHDVYAFEPSFDGVRAPATLLARATMHRALARADIVAAVSEFTAERVSSLFRTPANKIVVVGNGVEEHFFSAPAIAVETFLPDLKPPYVIAVGGLTHKKGAPHLLQLARALHSRAPHITLAITGPVEERYQASVAGLSNVRLLGRGYSNEHLHALVAQAALMVTLSEYEGFGIPVLEAMAAGVPVIAGARAALPEIVGDAGIIVEPTDASAVVAAVIDALADTSARNALIAQARRRARAYSWAACVGKLHDAMIQHAPRRPTSTPPHTPS